MAARRSRNILLRLTGDSSDARKAVRDTREELRRLSREQATAHVDVSIAQAERQLLGFRRQFEALSREKATPEVDLKLAKLARQIETTELRLARLGRRKVSIDVDIRRGSLERLGAGIGSVERGISGFNKGIANFFRSIPVVGQMIAVVIDGFVSLSESVGELAASLVSNLGQAIAKTLPGLGSLVGAAAGAVGSIVGIAAQAAGMAVALGGLVIIVNAVVQAIIALGGVLVALGASFAAAIAGAGALAIALGGVFIPIIVVAVALMTRFTAILKAHQAQQQALAQSTQEQKTAEQQRAAALAESRAAQDRLKQATVDGNRAMAQSFMDLRDAQLGLERSQLGVKEARLSLKEAQKNLRDFLSAQGAAGPKLSELAKQFSNVEFNPAGARGILSEATGKDVKDPLELQRRILAVQQAQLGIKESVNQTAHAEDDLAQATKKRGDFVRRGIRAYAPYRSALRAVQTANRRVAAAEGQVSAAQRKRDDALKKLTGTERESLSRLDKFLNAFKSLAKAVSDPVFKALNDVFDSLKGKMGGFKEALREVGQAIGDNLRGLGVFLGDPKTQRAFRVMAAGAADLVRTLGGRAFRSFLTIMREVALTALPTVKRLASDVADALGRVARQPDKIHHATSFVIGQFRAWLRLAGSVLGLVKDIFLPASGAGKNLADSMRHVVDHWREWIRANPDKVRDFFRNAVHRAKQIVQGIKDVVHWLTNDLPAAAATAKHAFEKVYKVVKTVVDAIKFIKNAGEGKFKIFGHTIDLGAGPVDVAEGPMLLPRAIAKALGGGGQTQLEKAILKALKEADKHRPKNEDLRSPDARTSGAHASAAGGVNFHAHITVPGGGSPDPKTTIAKFGREAQKLGLVAP